MDAGAFLKLEIAEWTAKQEFVKPITQLISAFTKQASLWLPITGLHNPSTLKIDHAYTHQWEVIWYPAEDQIYFNSQRWLGSRRLALKRHQNDAWLVQATALITMEELRVILDAIISASPLEAMAVLSTKE
jgi:hypothetical protein